METRAMAKGSKGEAKSKTQKWGKTQVLTKPGPSAITKDGDILSSKSFLGNLVQNSPRRKADAVFNHPKEVAASKKRIYQVH